MTTHNPRTRQITDHSDRRHRDGDATQQQLAGRVSPTLAKEFEPEPDAILHAEASIECLLRLGRWRGACEVVAVHISKRFVGIATGPTLSEADARYVTGLVGHWLQQGLATFAVNVLERRAIDQDLQRGHVTRESHPAELDLCERTLRRLDAMKIYTVAALAAEFEAWYSIGRGPRQIGNVELAAIYAELDRHGFVGPRAKAARARSYRHNGERRK